VLVLVLFTAEEARKTVVFAIDLSFKTLKPRID
jgi:hypothetical protein